MSDSMQVDHTSAVTMTQLFDVLAESSPDALPMFQREAGGWRGISYREFKQKVRACGLAARKAGLKNGDVACVLAGASPDWMITDFGLQGAGLTVAGIYPTEPPPKVAYILQDSNAAIVFVDQAHQRDKILEIWDQCLSLKFIVCFDASVAEQINDSRVIAFSQWLADGEAEQAADPEAWEQSIATVKPEDTAILIYTSGTTGPPKGAMLTHRNIVTIARRNAPYFNFKPGWKRPAFLPLCHVAERGITYCGLYGGVESYFIDDPNALGQVCLELQPNFFLGVPRIFEKFRAASFGWYAQQSDEVKAQYDAALAQGHQYADRRVAGEDIPESLIDACRADIAGVIGDMRRAIGLGEAVELSTGGMRFPPELLKWYLAVGIPFRETYGMTECGLISMNRPEAFRMDSAGTPCEFGEVKLSDQGEILIRGDHVFAGYLGKPEKTAEAIQDGWFHTGDVGQFDDDGFLFIVDRMKDIIITSGGKNITPTEVELKLKHAAIIAEAVIIGEARKFVSALIFVDRMAASTLVPGEDDLEKLCAHPAILEAVEQAVETANQSLSRVEQVKAFRLVPKELMPDDEEVTPTLKIKRKVVADKWSALIEDMYTEES